MPVQAPGPVAGRQHVSTEHEEEVVPPRARARLRVPAAVPLGPRGRVPGAQPPAGGGLPRPRLLDPTHGRGVPVAAGGRRVVGGAGARLPHSGRLQRDYTEGQVEAFLQHWRCREGSFWMPLPPRDEPQAEAQSEAHSADVALRRVVSRAISEAPPELGEARGALSKKWSKRKAELVKELSAELKVRGGASADELINGAEILFMRSCVADVQRAAAELRG
ncbi:unnamed protein product [Prorocentrum cordatum]|uniref:Uncharacterized protein n=1 Tax=Prorocentrum cordatum TaxID=2364126 RepID=A0ABN9WDV4_9DINO|nr:unnamed protein product [Polarella glacialis]